MIRIFIIIALLTVSACVKHSPDLTGLWVREIDEPQMFMSGEELMAIYRDSTLFLTNTMKFDHKDSTLQCTMDVTVRIDGYWTKNDDGDLMMHYNPETLTVSADSSGFNIFATEANVNVPNDIAELTYNELKKGIVSYYYSGYSSLAASGGLTLMSPQIIESLLYANVGSETIIWEKIPMYNR